MTIEEMQKGYKNEVQYQKHMLRNLGYWFQLFLTLSAIGLVLIYYFHKTSILLMVVGIVLMVVGVLGMLIFGYASWRGRRNVDLIIKDYQKKIKQIKNLDHNASENEIIKFESTK